MGFHLASRRGSRRPRSLPLIMDGQSCSNTTRSPERGRMSTMVYYEAIGLEVNGECVQQSTCDHSVRASGVGDIRDSRQRVKERCM